MERTDYRKERVCRESIQIKILIITDEISQWSHKFDCYAKGDTVKINRNVSMFSIENEMIKIVIKSDIAKVRGQRYDIAIIDKYIPKNVLLEILCPSVKQRYYTDNYYAETEQHIWIDYYTHNIGVKLKWYQKMLIKTYDTVLTKKRKIMKRRNKNDS